MSNGRILQCGVPRSAGSGNARDGVDCLVTTNRQKSAEAVVAAEMSGEGPNSCACEMKQNVQAANVSCAENKGHLPLRPKS